MKKKTLVSVLAMTSASMAAYANANLDQIKTEVDQWVGAEKPIVGERCVDISKWYHDFSVFGFPFLPGTYSCRLLPR